MSDLPMQFSVSSQVRGGNQKSPAGYDTTAAAPSEKSRHAWPSYQSSLEPTQESEDTTGGITSHHQHHRIPETAAANPAITSSLKRLNSPHLRSLWTLLPLLVLLISSAIVPVAWLLPSGSIFYVVNLAGVTATLDTTQIAQRCLWFPLQLQKQRQLLLLLGVMPMGFVLLVWLLPLTWSRQRRDDTLRTQALNVAAGPGGRVAAALKALPVSEAMGAEAATAALQSPHLRSCEATDASADTFTNTDTWQHCYSGSRCVVGGASSGHSNTGRTPASTCVGAVSCNHSLCRGPFNMAPTAPETPATSRWVLAPEASTPSLMSCLSPSLSAAAASSDVQGGQVEATRLIHAEKHAVHRASGWRGACDILTPLPMPRPSQSSVSPSTHQPVVMAPGSSKLLQSSGLVAFLSAPASLVRPLPSPSAASHCSRQAVRPLELNLRPSLTKPPLSTLLSTLPGADGDEGMLAATEVDHIKPLPRQHHSPLLYTPHRRSYFLHFQVDLTAAGDGEARGEAPRSSG